MGFFGPPPQKQTTYRTVSRLDLPWRFLIAVSLRRQNRTFGAPSTAPSSRSSGATALCFAAWTERKRWWSVRVGGEGRRGTFSFFSDFLGVLLISAPEKHPSFSMASYGLHLQYSISFGCRECTSRAISMSISQIWWEQHRNIAQHRKKHRRRRSLLQCGLPLFVPPHRMATKARAGHRDAVGE